MKESEAVTMTETTADNEGEQSTSIQVSFQELQGKKGSPIFRIIKLFNLILNKLNLVNFSVIYFSQEKGEVDKHNFII